MNSFLTRDWIPAVLINVKCITPLVFVEKTTLSVLFCNWTQTGVQQDVAGLGLFNKGGERDGTSQTCGR